MDLNFIANDCCLEIVPCLRSYHHPLFVYRKEPPIDMLVYVLEFKTAAITKYPDSCRRQKEKEEGHCAALPPMRARCPKEVNENVVHGCLPSERKCSFCEMLLFSANIARIQNNIESLTFWRTRRTRSSRSSSAPNEKPKRLDITCASE